MSKFKRSRNVFVVPLYMENYRNVDLAEYKIPNTLRVDVMIENMSGKILHPALGRSQEWNY